MNKELLQERKKMIYDFICDELYVPMKAKEMAIVLNVPKSQRGELLEVLDALTADGKVEISGRGKYVKSEGKYLTGVFTAHPRGFGFVTVEGEEARIRMRGQNRLLRNWRPNWHRLFRSASMRFRCSD